MIERDCDCVRTAERHKAKPFLPHEDKHTAFNMQSQPLNVKRSVFCMPSVLYRNSVANARIFSNTVRGCRRHAKVLTVNELGPILHIKCIRT